MKNYLTVSDLGLKDTHERGNVSIWVYAPEIGVNHIECGECKNMVFSVTPYCPYCGSLMYNHAEVAQKYSEDCDKRMKKIAEDRKNDI